MIISIDLDNTLIDTHQTFKTFCNNYGYSLNLPITDWYFNDQSIQTKTFLAEAIQTNKIAETLFDGMIWNKKIPKILKALSKKHTLLFISSRSIDMQHQTCIQLQKNGIDLSNIKILCTGNTSKINVLKNFKIDLHIDDAPNILEECLMHNISHIMYSNEMTSYNHYLRSKVHHWANTWENVLNIIKTI